MKIVISGNEVTLRESDVKIAKETINRFMSKLKEGAIENNMPTLYITILAVMNVKSSELLKTIEPQKLEEIMQLLKERGYPEKMDNRLMCDGPFFYEKTVDHITECMQ